MGKLFLGLLVYGFTTCFIIGIGGAFWFMHEFQKPGPATSDTLFTVERGSGLNIISRDLEAQNLINHDLIFKIGTLALRKQSELKAGEYNIAQGLSTHDIINLIAAGKVVERRFTIREGLTSFEIVRLLNVIETLSGKIDKIPAEGSLLPQTYDYRLGEDRQAIIERLSEKMSTVMDELWPKRAKGLPFTTKEEAMTLASIIEKETGVAEERERVAGVFVNRLRKGMALQTDPTVIYAITKGKHKNDGKGPLGRRLLRKDLSYDSPYNTYKYPGLPPGPIANPGRASIKAALNPEEHDYIFFVADGTGGHMFARTLKEHNANVANWRKIRKQKNN